MKIKNLILVKLSILMVSQAVNSQSKTGELPVIDISKQYTEKKQVLSEIADIEYVPLETNDDVLLSGDAVLSYVSNKYIVTYEPRRGNIFVFNRTGKINSHFNHRGESGQEYSWISSGVIFDEKNEEIFVCSQSIQVYSLSGEYKRTLRINTMQNKSSVYDFDNDALLIYDDVIIDPGWEETTKKNPYRFVSKKDGSIISVLDIHFPKRYSSQQIIRYDDNKYSTRHINYPARSMNYGQNLVIADISSDTLYLLTQNKKLTPMLTRKPSVHKSEQRSIWVTYLTTDKFIIIGLINIDFKSRGGKIPYLMYEFDTGEIFKISILDYDMKTWSPYTSPVIEKNMTAELIQPSSIIEAYKKKQLNENLKNTAMSLDEDDNPVVRIIKFK